jgi:hypothetical protein
MGALVPSCFKSRVYAKGLEKTQQTGLKLLVKKAILIFLILMEIERI